MRVWLKQELPELASESYPDDQIVHWLPIPAGGHEYDLEGHGITRHRDGSYLVWFSEMPTDDEPKTLVEAIDCFANRGRGWLR